MLLINKEKMRNKRVWDNKYRKYYFITYARKKHYNI